VQASNPSPLPAVPVRLAGAEAPAGEVLVLAGAVAAASLADELAAAEPVPEEPVPDGLVPDGLVPDGLVPDGLVPDGVCLPLARMERIWESSVPYVAVTRTPGPGTSTWIS
jgi:hypothetical protein